MNLWTELAGIPAGSVRPARCAADEHCTPVATSRSLLEHLRGWLSRQISAVRFANMQTVAMHQSPFDRRKRMVTLAVDTAGASSLGHRITIPFLDVDVAKSILERLYVETRSTEFRW